jgi:hypothetical protein
MVEMAVEDSNLPVSRQAVMNCAVVLRDVAGQVVSWKAMVDK